jgi:hypothetical protein
MPIADLDHLTPDDLVMLARNRRDAGMALDELVTMVEAHRRDTHCRQWGCYGREYAVMLDSYGEHPHQLMQMLTCAVERLAELEPEVTPS